MLRLANRAHMKNTVSRPALLVLLISVLSPLLHISCKKDDLLLLKRGGEGKIKQNTFFNEFVKGAVPMAKAGPNSRESKEVHLCRQATRSQLLWKQGAATQQAGQCATLLVSGCGRRPAPFRYSNFLSTSLPGLIPPEDHLFLSCWRERN